MFPFVCCCPIRALHADTPTGRCVRQCSVYLRMPGTSLSCPVCVCVMLMPVLKGKQRGVWTPLTAALTMKQGHTLTSCQQRFNYTLTHRNSKHTHTHLYQLFESTVMNGQRWKMCLLWSSLQLSGGSWTFPPFYHNQQLHYWAAKMESWLSPLLTKGAACTRTHTKQAQEKRTTKREKKKKENRACLKILADWHTTADWVKAE